MAVKQVFTGDTKDLEAAYKRLERENLRYRQTLQQTLTSAQRDNLDLIGGFDLSIGSMAKMVTGVLSVKAAFDALRAAHQQYTTDLAAAGEKQKEFFGAAGRTAFATSLRPERVAAFASQQPYASNVDATTALREVAGAIPAESPERQEQVAGAAARFAPITEIASFSRLLGELADALPNRTGDQLAGLGIVLQQKAGNDADQLTNEGFLRAMKILQGSGAMTPEQSLGFGVAAMQADVPVKLLETIAAAIEDPGEPAKRAGRRLTPEEAAKDRFARTGTAEERAKLFMSDEAIQKAILGTKGAAQFRQIAAAGDTQKIIEELQRTDMARLANQTFIDARKDPVTGQAYDEAEAAKNLEREQRRMGQEGSRRRIRAIQTDAALANTDFVSRAAAKSAIATGTFFGDMFAAATQEQPGGEIDGRVQRRARQGDQPWRAPMSLPMGRDPDDPQMKEQNELLREMNSNIRALRAPVATPNAHSE